VHKAIQAVCERTNMGVGLAKVSLLNCAGPIEPQLSTRRPRQCRLVLASRVTASGGLPFSSWISGGRGASHSDYLTDIVADRVTGPQYFLMEFNGNGHTGSGEFPEHGVPP
jgi:hypothetical protein